MYIYSRHKTLRSIIIIGKTEFITIKNQTDNNVEKKH